MFFLVKDKYEYVWVIMKIEDKQVVVVKEIYGKLEFRIDVEKNRKFFGEMLQKVEELGGFCYIFFDLVYEQSSGSFKDKLIYIYWQVIGLVFLFYCYKKERSYSRLLDSVFY